MSEYILRRLLLVIPTVFISSGIIFGLMRIVPGDAAQSMARQRAEGREITEALIQEVRAELGLNKPIHIQYIEFWQSVFNGTWGRSLYTKRAVWSELAERLPVSLQLMFMAITFAITWGMGVGILSALKQDTPWDYLFRSMAIGALSVPSFWLATLIIVMPSVWFHWTPLSKFYPFFDDPIANLKLMIFPALILGANQGAPIMRMTRTMMLEVLRQDYVRTARAKGLAERMVIFRHSVRNALIPVVTILGLQILTGIGGALVLETVFGLPGMGRLLVITSLSRRDYPMVQGITLFTGLSIVFVNLLVDLSYGVLDPRVKYR